MSLTESSSLADSPCLQPQETLGHARTSAGVMNGHGGGGLGCCRAQAAPTLPPVGDTAGTQLDRRIERAVRVAQLHRCSVFVITACQLLLWLVCVPVTEVISAGGIGHSQLLASCLGCMAGAWPVSTRHPTCPRKLFLWDLLGSVCTPAPALSPESTCSKQELHGLGQLRVSQMLCTILLGRGPTCKSPPQ